MTDPFTIVAHDEAFPGDAVVPPIFQTSLFAFASYQELEDTMAGRKRRPIYSRGDNPTVAAFETKLAALEGAEAARGFASGMAAISAAVLAGRAWRQLGRLPPRRCLAGAHQGAVGLGAPL
jgi:cystathionine beta-lyase/cystathionine gamma-synthase